MHVLLHTHTHTQIAVREGVGLGWGSRQVRTIKNNACTREGKKREEDYEKGKVIFSFLT